ncbi:MAG: sensor of ECF-type sigma factor [Bacteroidota bacterium]
MKNKITYIFLFFLALQFGFSQENDPRKERIKSLKIAFISQKLALTSVEAEKFWPIYNKYDEKIMVLKEAQMKLRHQRRVGTDEEALKKIEEAEEKEAEVMVLKKKMRAELIPVITAEKVLKLEQLEQEFHRKLLEKLNERRGNRPPPRR